TVSWSNTAATFSSTTCPLGAGTPAPTTSCVSPTCSVTYSPSAVGPHTITATYPGDPTHLDSTGTTVVTARPRSTSTTVTCSPARSEERRAGRGTTTRTDTTPDRIATTPTATASFSRTSPPSFAPARTLTS